MDPNQPPAWPGGQSPGQTPAQPAWPSGQPGQPQAWPGSQPPGWYPPMGGAPGYPMQQPPQGTTNGFAIAAFITGLLGMCLLALPFGFVALSQIKQRGQQGRGLAIAGMVISVAWLVFGVLIGVVAAVTDHSSSTGSGVYPSADPTGTTGYTLLRNLKTGDCVNGVGVGTRIKGATVVDCAQPHDGEVLTTFRLPTYDSDQAARDYAETQCSQPFDQLNRDDLKLFWYRPETSTDWAQDGSVQCIVRNAQGGKLTGKVTR
ncbi:DUF4190 domain-containing protein [Nocardia sp. NPDC088792]|uniref:DUF4190 domain-containing protein n=1 Tax=Nocardia sp. NPDC088792 TaxID=3364332 RepID=UPI0038177E66